MKNNNVKLGCDKLALYNGFPVRKYKFPDWPHFESDEINAVTNVLLSGKVNYWTGQECQKFEKEFSNFLGSKYSISLANGTVALELALYALDIGEGDDVVVTSRTFIASASSIIACGAKPIFSDVDFESQNITANTIESVLTPSTKAIVVVHLAGWPCDMDNIIKLAKKWNIKIIEDCAQAHGARYKKQFVGTFGDIGVFSFCQDKIITTGGEGGMLVTNKKALWETSWSYKDHGKNISLLKMDRNASSNFKWIHDSFGTNWRMTEMQAAIGRVQLQKLSGWLAQRRKNALYLIRKLHGIKGVRIPIPPKDIEHSYYKFYIFIRTEDIKHDWSRERIQRAISSEGIPCKVGICPEVYLEKCFPEGWRPQKRHGVAKQLGDTSLMFDVHPMLTESEMKDTYFAIKKVFECAVI